MHQEQYFHLLGKIELIKAPDPVQAKKDFIARQPMGRLGTAEEIAAVAVYLAGDDATFTTGTTISVDGGISI